MKHYTLLLLLGTILLLSACRKESSTIIGEIDTTEETEFEAVVFSGQISDREYNGLQATIDIYQFESKVGSVTTDAEGHYITEEVFIEPDIEVTFDIFSTNYRNKYRRITRGKGLHDSQDYNLVSIEDAFGGPSQFFENPGSDDLIRVYRTILDVNGDPIPNLFCSVVYDVQQTGPSSFSTNGGIDITDENGYMEILLSKGEELFHSASSYFDDENIECVTPFMIQDTTLLDFFFPYQYLGTLTEDYEITESPDIAIHPTNYNVTGRLLNCDNTPVLNGRATIRVSYANGTFPNTLSFETTSFDSDGNFTIDFDICYYGQFSGVLTGLSDDGLQSEWLFTIEVNQDNTIDDLVICGSVLEDESYLNLQIGNVKTLDGISFPQNVTTESSILSLGFHPDHGNIQLNINEIAIGDNPIDLLSLNFVTNDDEPYGFRSQFGELNLDVISIQDDYITGYIKGSTETNELGIQEISGELYIKYQ